MKKLCDICSCVSCNTYRKYKTLPTTQQTTTPTSQQFVSTLFLLNVSFSLSRCVPESLPYGGDRKKHSMSFPSVDTTDSTDSTDSALFRKYPSTEVRTNR